MACGACSSRNSPSKFVVTTASGQKIIKNTEVEARAEVARKGGSYIKQ